MWSWFTGGKNDIKGIKVTHIKAIDSEGSLVIYSEGTSGKKVAALKGTAIYELGMRLRRVVNYDRDISDNIVNITHPLDKFYFNSQYDIQEAELLIRQSQEERKHRDKNNGKKNQANIKKKPSDKDRILDIESGYIEEDQESGSQGNLSNEEKSEKVTYIATSAESNHYAPIKDKDINKEEGGEEEENKDPKRFILSLEEIKRLDDIDKAAHQHFVCRLVSSYPIVTMRPFVNEFYSRFIDKGSPYVIFEEEVYSVYRIWMNSGLAQASLCRSLVTFLKKRESMGDLWSVENMESFLVCNLYNDYEDIFSDLESELSLTKWGQHYMPMENYKDKNTINGNNIIKNPKDFYVERAMERKNRRARIYALKEVQRLWMYNKSKESLLRRIMDPESFEDDLETLKEHTEPKESFNQQKNDNESEKGNINSEKKNQYKASFKEQRILREVIEAQIAASSIHTECWEKVMDPIRKIIIEVRDICNQVCINKIRQERKDEPIDFDTSFLRFKAGVVETMNGERPNHDENDHNRDGQDVGIKIEDPTDVKENVENNRKNVAYDPDVPHLPNPTLDRLLLYLEKIDTSFLSAVRYQDPDHLKKKQRYYSPFNRRNNLNEEDNFYSSEEEEEYEDYDDYYEED